MPRRGCLLAVLASLIGMAACVFWSPYYWQDPIRAMVVDNETNCCTAREKLMATRRRFPAAIVAAIRDGKALAIRAGTRPHRFIRIWAVVVEGRVFVRSWSLKPRSWYRTFLTEPRGAIEVGGRRIPVRAVCTRSERLKKAVSGAYLEKYNTGGLIKFARDLGGPKSRATTTELVPSGPGGSGF